MYAVVIVPVLFAACLIAVVRLVESHPCVLAGRLLEILRFPGSEQWQRNFDTIVAVCEKARREGLLSLESDLKDESIAGEKLFHDGVLHVLDGLAPETLKKIMTNQIQSRKNVLISPICSFFTLLSALIPITIALSLISVVWLEGAFKTSGIITAATAGGILCLFIPVAMALLNKASEAMLIMRQIAEGVNMLQAGYNPRIVSAVLQSMVDGTDDSRNDSIWFAGWFDVFSLFSFQHTDQWIPREPATRLASETTNAPDPATDDAEPRSDSDETTELVESEPGHNGNVIPFRKNNHSKESNDFLSQDAIDGLINQIESGPAPTGSGINADTCRGRKHTESEENVVGESEMKLLFVAEVLNEKIKENTRPEIEVELEYARQITVMNPELDSFRNKALFSIQYFLPDEKERIKLSPAGRNKEFFSAQSSKTVGVAYISPGVVDMIENALLGGVSREGTEYTYPPKTTRALFFEIMFPILNGPLTRILPGDIAYTPFTKNHAGPLPDSEKLILAAYRLKWEEVEASFCVVVAPEFFNNELPPLEEDVVSTAAGQSDTDSEQDIDMRFEMKHLNKIPTEVAASILKREHPQLAAVALGMMEPARAAKALKAMYEDWPVLKEISFRIPYIDTMINPHALGICFRMLEADAAKFAPGIQRSGIKTMVEILRRIGRKTESELMDQLSEHDPEMAEAIKQSMITFDDIVKISDRDTQMVIRQIDEKTLTTALIDSSPEVREKIFNNVSTRARERLQDDMKYMGPFRSREIEEARQHIINTIRGMIDSGEIACQLRPLDW